MHDVGARESEFAVSEVPTRYIQLILAAEYLEHGTCLSFPTVEVEPVFNLVFSNSTIRG